MAKGDIIIEISGHHWDWIPHPDGGFLVRVFAYSQQKKKPKTRRRFLVLVHWVLTGSGIRRLIDKLSDQFEWE
jgi:hypothetical protein